jgi:hypothetical protein
MMQTGTKIGDICCVNKSLWRLPDAHGDVKRKVLDRILIAVRNVGYLAKLPDALLAGRISLF